MSDASISFPMLGDWSINPSNYISIFGFKIYWYAIIIATGFLIAVIYVCKRAPEFGITADNVLDEILIGVPLALICARAYYVVFNWSLYKDNPIEILNIRNGGTAIYGVLIGAFLAMFIYTRIKKIPLAAMLDLISIGFIIGQFIGRWGNFINREAYGGETNIFCRMVLTRRDGTSISVHPTFLYESLWNFAGFIIIHFASKRFRRYDGQVFMWYITWYGFGRMFIEGLRTDSLYIPNTNIRVSQLLSFVLFLVFGSLLLYNRIKVKHDPDRDLYVNRIKTKAVIENPSAETAEDNPSDNEESLDDTMTSNTDKADNVSGEPPAENT